MYMCIYIHVCINIYLNTYTLVYIRRPLQSVERVRLHLLAYKPTSRSKAQKRTSVQPAQIARQLKSRNPALQAPRQLESWNLTVQAPRQLESWNLSILSSSIGDLLGRNSPPQAATGRQLSGPRIQQISLNRCSRLHRSGKWLSWVPCLSQSSLKACTDHPK